MSWSIVCDETNSLVHIVFTGETTAAELHQASTEAITLANQRGAIRFLVDLEAALSRVSALAVWSLPTQQYPAQGLARNSQVAILMPRDEKTREDARFYETAWLASSTGSSLG